VVRGEVFRLPPHRGARGHEQRGARYAVVVQADEFVDLSTTLVAPTSASALAATFRPTIALDGVRHACSSNRRPWSTPSASADRPDASM
jgi:mRNA interferase MazF